MASSALVLLCAVLGQVQGKPDRGESLQPLLKTKVSLTESEAHFEQRIAIGASLDESKDGKALTVSVDESNFECNWRENPNCWTDRVWDYLKKQDNDNSACLSKELEAKRSLDGLLALVNEATNLTASQNTTLHNALFHIQTAVLARDQAEVNFRAAMEVCNNTQEERRRNELLPFYMELQELAHIANPTYRSEVEHSDAENMATPEAQAADAAIADSLTSFVELQSEVDSGSSITDLSRLQTSSLQNAGQEACHKFASLLESHKELSHIHQPGMCNIDGNRTRVDLERNFTYAYLAIAGLYDQKHQEIANETYTCVETALAPIRDTTNHSNAMINQSMEEIFAARAIITVLVPILQDLDLAELNMWQAGDVMNDTCHAEYNLNCVTQPNTRYDGDILEGPFTINTVQLCSGVCTTNTACIGFTFNTTSRQCSLLGNATGAGFTIVSEGTGYTSGDRCEAGAGRTTTLRLTSADSHMDVIRNDIEDLGPCAGQNTFVLEPRTWTPSDPGWWNGALVPDTVYPSGDNHRYPAVPLHGAFNMEFNITHGNPTTGYTLGYGYGNGDTTDSPDQLYRS